MVEFPEKCFFTPVIYSDFHCNQLNEAKSSSTDDMIFSRPSISISQSASLLAFLGFNVVFLIYISWKIVKKVNNFHSHIWNGPCVCYRDLRTSLTSVIYTKIYASIT